VIHAEENAIAKLARSHESGDGADMFITHAPCAQCARMILQSGIQRVWYRKTYKNTLGVEYLQRHGVECKQVP
jgi:dCMP deaminase